MKLISLKPNAQYDLVHGAPAVVEKDNDGSWLFRYNILPEMGVPEDGDGKEVQIGWKCRELRLWEKPERRNVKKAIIRSVLDESAEFSLVNSYNKHILGIKEDEEAVDEYKDYLQFLEDVDEMLLTDFQN